MFLEIFKCIFWNFEFKCMVWKILIIDRERMVIFYYDKGVKIKYLCFYFFM